MQYSTLGSSGLEVSRVCLGSMTWGTQNNQQDADQQIEYALSQGVNFIDTAEIYSIPPNKESYGRTETIIGDWFYRNPDRRDELILTSKIAPGFHYIRDGAMLSSETVIAAVDASLKRLQTDRIDLYQLHWPNRKTPHFNRHKPNQLRFSEVDPEVELAGMLDILQGLKSCIDAGKIRFCGLSDDTPWGVSSYLKLSEKYDLPRMVSIQNEFSLVHSKDWPYLIEQCVHEQMAFLPWSPLGAGLLTGKYLNGARPEGSRWSFAQRNGTFRDTEMGQSAVAEYKALAERNGMTAAQMALKWCDQVDGVTSTIIGATTMDQLRENIAAFDLTLSDQLLEEIEAIRTRYPMTF